MKTELKGMEFFSEETLQEMEMQAIHGGGTDALATDNCRGGYCAAGCGIGTMPSEDEVL